MSIAKKIINVSQIKSFIKRKDLLLYGVLFFRNIQNKAYRTFCIDYINNPRVLHFNKFGDNNPEKNVYWIREGVEEQGMFSLCVWTLRYLEFAEKFNLIPYISWNESISYCKKDDIGRSKNPFEYFFEQTSGLKYDDVINSCNVAISRKKDRAYGNVADSYEFSEDEISRLCVIWKKYFVLRANLKNKFDYKIKTLFGSNKILGIHVRGVDWKKFKFSGHPIVVSIDEYINEAKRAINIYGYDRVFLATDSEETVDEFRCIFGEKLLYHLEIARTPKDSKMLVIFDDTNDPYELGVDILLDAFTLASCDGLIAGLSYVSYAVQIIKQSEKKPFEYLRIIDKGLYDKNNVKASKAPKIERRVWKKKN